MNKLDLSLQHNMSSLFESAHTLLHHESIQLQESVLSILSRLLELNNLFGKSLVPKYGKSGAMGCVVDVAKYLDSDSNNTVRKACELLGFLFRYLDLKSFNGRICQDIILKWLNVLTKLSQGCSCLAPLKRKLLCHIADEFHKCNNACDHLFLLELQLRNSSFKDLCSRLGGIGEEEEKQTFCMYESIMIEQFILDFVKECAQDLECFCK